MNMEEFLETLPIEVLNKLNNNIKNQTKRNMLLKMIREEIIRKSKTSANSLIDINKDWFSLPLYNMLKEENIKTVDELQKLDISKLKKLDKITTEELLWTKKTYNFSHLDSKSLTKK